MNRTLEAISTIFLAAISFILLMQAVPVHAQTAAESQHKPPKMTSLRSDEDYSYLRDARNRSGAWWERFKYIPLDETGGIYVTFGDEVRLRFEFYDNNEFGSGRKPDENYFRLRLLPYADLHLGPCVRLFTQLQGAWSNRSEETTAEDGSGTWRRISRREILPVRPS